MNAGRRRRNEAACPTRRDEASYLRTGASTIYREQGKRLIAIKFSVNRGRDLASAWRRRDEGSAVDSRGVIGRSGAASSSRCRRRRPG